jgi:hypothetical protein
MISDRNGIALACLLMLIGGFVSAACTPATGPAVGQLGSCILIRASVDAEASPPMAPLAIAEDVAQYCSTDAVTVVSTLGALKTEKTRQASKDGGK